jgi:hypothetical protein
MRENRGRNLPATKSSRVCLEKRAEVSKTLKYFSTRVREDVCG